MNNENISTYNDQDELRRLASFPDSNPNPIIEIDPSGKLLYHNPAASNTFSGLEDLNANYPQLDRIVTESWQSRGVGFGSVQLHEFRHENHIYEAHVSLAEATNSIRIYFQDITIRKQFEDALRENEQRLRHIVEHSTNLFYSHTADHVLTYLSPRSRDLLDCEPEEAMVRWTEFATEHPINETGFETTQKAIDTGEAQPPYELQLIGKKGRVIWVEVRETPVLRNGRTVEIVGALTEITDRKQKDEALKASEKRYRQIFDNAPIGILHYDQESVVTDCNDTHLKILDSERERIIGANLLDSLVDEQMLNLVKGTLKGETGTFEGVYNPIAGNRRTAIKAEFAPVVTDDNRITGGVAIVEDISERLKTERELLVQTAYLEELFDSSPDVIAILDNQDRIMKVNREFTRVFGYEAEEVKGIPINDLIVPEELSEEGKSATAKVTQGEMVDFETIRKTKDGRRINVSVIGKPVLLKGDQLAVYGIYRDITKRKQTEEDLRKTEEQLLQAQKMEAVGRLAGGVAHDFNNLLTAIGGHVEMALLGLKSDDPIFNDLIGIEEAADRAATLTRQLLAFSRKQPLSPKIVNLNEIIQSMDTMLRRVIGEDIDLSTIPGDDLWKVKVDPSQIEQVIVNLAINARDAMPKGGKLTLETTNVTINEDYIGSRPEVLTGNYVMLAVSDSGSGMTEGVVDKIFEPFFTTKEKGKGTGLGLSTVYGIVKQSDGYIWVYSEPDKGTAFKIYLPMVEGDAEDIKTKRVYFDTPHGDETILVVEDEDSVRNLSVKTLKRLGYTIYEASNGDKAIEICRSLNKPVDLILSDVIMPRMNGAEMVEKIKAELWKDVKTLFVSGYTENAIVHDGVLNPGMPYLQKPFRLVDLARRVRTELDK